MPPSLKLRVGQSYRRSALFRARHPRRIHVYGIGGPKTGTHSVAGLFGGKYRAEHQPRERETVRLVLDREAGRLSDAEARRVVLRRDRELWLEADISFLNIHFVDILAAEYPEAKFLLTIREPRSWLRSMINQDLSCRGTSIDSIWRPLGEASLESVVYSPCETVLAENRLPSIERLLAKWRLPIERARACVEPGRLLIVHTNEIESRIGDIEAFAGAAPGSLAREKAHLFKAAKDYGVFDQVDPAHVDALIARDCADLVREFFSPAAPETMP